MRLSRLSFVSTAFALMPVVASAIAFPDVQSDYPHKAAIEALSDLGVIGGNPDGTFRPRNPVDRAAMLKMLYKAANLLPVVPTSKCFEDVPVTEWYSGYVCDAARRGYVSGYDEGGKKYFKPARPVSRAEALKLSLVVMGIANVSSSTQVAMYADVKPTDWVEPYVRTALAKKILPIPGQNVQNYLQTVPMERGEAAAYIWNTLAAKGWRDTAASSSAAGEASSSVASAASQSSRKHVEDGVSTDLILQKPFPFNDQRTFADKKPVTYRFTVAKTLVAQIMLWSDKKDARVTCRLYRIQADGFSSEYYLGHEEGNECHLRATLQPGDYQLQAQTTVPGAAISVDAKAGTGDGNDGFSEAKLLTPNKIRTDLLDANDLGDWFTFTVTTDTSVNNVPGTEHTVKITSTSTLGCIVYPLADVDLFGFEGPQCNQLYKYPVGTYMVNVRHPVPRAGKEGYSIELQ